MATITIPWGDGSGDNIYLTYTSASGDQTVEVSSDANTGSARSKVVTFASGIGSIVQQLAINQEAGQNTPNRDCITFKSDGENTISLSIHGTSNPTLYYSTDGTNWLLWNFSALSFSVGHPVFVYGSGNTSTQMGSSTSNYCSFVMGGTGKVTCEGSIMSLVAGDASRTTIPNNYYFYRLFYECTALVAAPTLPATTLKNYCYYEIFRGCSSLASAPTLPATSINSNCYRGMFYSCSSLVTAPALPATTLKSACYRNMFQYCTSLKNAPELKATTLLDTCYYYMFYGCTSLETAPTLPATTLVSQCYNYMFYGCSKLNYIKAMFTTTPGTSYTSNWVNGVASSGTFVKNSAASWTNTGNSAVPSRWTIQTASN